MDWMNNLFVVIVLTTMTGSIFYLFGIPFRKVWFKKDIRLLRFQMRVTQGAFVVPFVYIVLYLQARIYLPGVRSSINLFYHTPITVFLCIALACVWLYYFVKELIQRVRRRYQWMQVCRGNIPEEDEEVQELFTETCERLGVAGKVVLCRNDSVDMPCITYHHGFTVVLPLDCYTRKEAAIIFCHELCHYLHKDLYRKEAGTLASLMHAFNPLAGETVQELGLLCEEYCDSVACHKGGKEFTDKEYYGMVLDELRSGKKRERYNLLALADTRKNYERRMECMDKRMNKGLKKGAAILLSACFLVGSSITAVAAGEGITKAYKAVADATDTRTAEEAGVPLSDEEVIEEFARMYDLDPDSVVIMGEEGIELIGDTVVVNWPGIPAGHTFMTPGFSQVNGDSVYVSVVGSPSDIKYQAGIKDPDQLMRYIEGLGDGSHRLPITIDGRYYFFATNLDSSRSLDVQATVIR